MDLMEMLTRQLGDDGIRKVSDRVGADSESTAKAISAALPVLVGALAKNSASADGASALAGALERDHDGSVLDDLSGFLGRTSGESGQAILKHVLGERQRGAESALSQVSGLDSAKIAQILQMLAPLVLGALGKKKREAGLSPDDLAAQLGRERRQVERRAPQAGDLLSELLDRDGDGSALDDVAEIGAGLLGSLFGGKR